MLLSWIARVFGGTASGLAWWHLHHIWITARHCGSDGPPPVLMNGNTTINHPQSWEWFIPYIYGDLGDGLLLFYPHSTAILPWHIFGNSVLLWPAERIHRMQTISKQVYPFRVLPTSRSKEKRFVYTYAQVQISVSYSLNPSRRNATAYYSFKNQHISHKGGIYTYVYIWVTIKTPAEEFYTNVWLEYVVVNL